MLLGLLRECYSIQRSVKCTILIFPYTLPSSPTLQSIIFFTMFTPLVYGVGPTWLQRRILEVFPHRGVRKMKKIVDLMEERATMIYKAKKAALLQGDEAVVRQLGEGKDIMSVLSA